MNSSFSKYMIENFSKAKSREGFSAIELVIVVVIVGVIATAVVVGKEVIEQSRLKKTISQFNTFQSAIVTFQQKYDALPGDMPDATSVWGIIPDEPNCFYSGGTGTQTCDGDGNGGIDYENSAEGQEPARAWQHLANAQLIPGDYIGYFIYEECTLNWICWQPGINAPGSSMDESSVFTLRYIRSYPVDYWSGKLSTRNVIALGSSTGGSGLTGMWFRPIMTAEQAYQIDLAMDDGVPFTGIMTIPTNGYSAGCFTGGAEFSTSARYNVANKAKTCVLMLDFIAK